jgi:two-component system sensor kinase FixL
MMTATAHKPGFMHYRGSMADALGRADWRSSPLGPLEMWPPALKTALGIVLGAANAKVLLWGPDLLTFYNDACLPLLERSNHEIGKKYPPCGSAVWPTIRKHVDAAMGRGKRLPPQFKEVRCKDGAKQTGYFTICCTNICDDDGNVLGSITDIAETTGQVQLQEMLEAENRRFRELFDQAPVFLAFLSGPEFRVEYVNKAYERLVGRSDLVGKPVAEALPEIEQQGYVDLLREVYESGDTKVFRDSLIKLQLNRGTALEPRFLDFIYQPIVTGEDGTGLLVVGQDVTDQHFAEARAEVLRSQLHRAGRLSAMGTVANTLAHELNQPLTAIQNYAAGSRTLLNSGEEAPGALDNALKAIGENAHHAGEIIRRLRDMTERGMVRKEVFDLEEAIREAASLARVGQCEGVVLRYDFEPGAQASADRVQVQQVLLNLIRNAYEAGDKAGHREVSICTAVRGKWLEVRVMDTGEGIPPEALPALFEPFLSTKPGGMGVGLSISRTIVESQGGRIWAENEPGGGAVFCFTLPKA